MIRVRELLATTLLASCFGLSACDVDVSETGGQPPANETNINVDAKANSGEGEVGASGSVEAETR